MMQRTRLVKKEPDRSPGHNQNATTDIFETENWETGRIENRPARLRFCCKEHWPKEFTNEDR